MKKVREHLCCEARVAISEIGKIRLWCKYAHRARASSRSFRRLGSHKSHYSVCPFCARLTSLSYSKCSARLQIVYKVKWRDADTTCQGDNEARAREHERQRTHGRLHM